MGAWHRRPRPVVALTGYGSTVTDRTDLVPELDLARIRRYCAARIPAHVADLVRLEIEVEGRSVTIVERRPPWSSSMGPEWSRVPIARLRFTKSRGEWTLYWCDRNLRFHEYLYIDPSPDVGTLLAEIDADPTTIFWG
jgi:Protein of unknown function (DUF3024)